MRITRTQIDALADVIAEAQGSTRPADMLLHQFFRAHPEMGARDRSVVAEGFFAWLRRRRSLEFPASTFSSRPGIRSMRLRCMNESKVLKF